MLVVFWYFNPHGLPQEKTSFVLCGHTLNPSTGLAIWQITVLISKWNGVRVRIQSQFLITTGKTTPFS